MADYVQLESVRAWYDECGSGDPLVMLHGGVVDSRFFDPNVDALAAAFHVYRLDARGHGHTPDIEGQYVYADLAGDTIDFIERTIGGPTHLLGHSAGAGVALHVGVTRPDLVRKLVLISGVYHYSGLVPIGEIDTDQVVAAFGASYGAVSPDGEEHFPVVVAKDIELDLHEPALALSDLERVTSRTLVMVSDDDIINLEHMLAYYRGIKYSELAVVPGTSHFLTQEKPALCNAILLDFLTADAVPTVAPIRRAASV
jgi:pimeloyl-ACP methyl ester carboxylesterase